jgi:bifunctional DNA-binding transcriptional regulator/antitoxin component of YhaV-PrlF toxin-antitoxin module
MRFAKISKGGQVTVPAEIRKRWGTTRVLVEDWGDALVFRPIPADPIKAALGSLAGPGPSTDEMRAQGRREEAEIERKRLKALGW